MIEAHEDKDRDWRHAYHTRIRDHIAHLEALVASGAVRMSRRAIIAEAYAKAEREVQTALNHEAAQRARKNLPHHAREEAPTVKAATSGPGAEVDDLTELPPIHTARDLHDSALFPDPDDI